MKNYILKDDKLNNMVEAKIGNIAQFISVDEYGKVKYVHINNYKYDGNTELKELIEILINSARSKSVNIRSFSINCMKGNKLIRNKSINQLDEILQHIEKNINSSKNSIINENIDIFDGGVSGVILGDVIEFAPEDTPKCVDKEGVCRFPKDLGITILEKIYGVNIELDFSENYRVEFSIHPNREGIEKKHVIIWEYEEYEDYNSSYNIVWPNRFSRFIGDKLFGLLIAETFELKVPYTIAMCRNIAPFIFGESTGINETWIRTCPIVKEPGKYYTGKTWTDPYELMFAEEKKGNMDINIASILSQKSVECIYSGGAIIRKNINDDVIEGVIGYGDDFMVGERLPETLPLSVVEKIRVEIEKIREYYNMLGDVSIEWVFDGSDIWIVQLNQIKTSGSKNIIVDGDVEKYFDFHIEWGLEALREEIKNEKYKICGINLIGNIGITSHFGDVLRQSKIVSKVTNI